MQAMGGGSSKSGWQPSSAASGERKLTASGYDVTPLTAEQRAAAAASLSPFQRHVTLEVLCRSIP